MGLSADSSQEEGLHLPPAPPSPQQQAPRQVYGESETPSSHLLSLPVTALIGQSARGGQSSSRISNLLMQVQSPEPGHAEGGFRGFH